MTIDDMTATGGDFLNNTPQPNTGSLIKVIGVGGGGSNAIQHMYEQGINDVSFVICNTDWQALKNSIVPNKLLIGNSGLGAGNKPEVGRQAAEETADDIANLFNDGTQMVFITAGMGGGTGTGAAPVVAKIAREKGMLTIGIVTIPFLFEGQKKILKALDGAEEMSKYVDALLVINNERLTEIYPDLNFINGFGKADDTLTTAARGISELITNNTATINIDFNDVDTTLRNGGAAVISIGYGEGEGRVTAAINDALSSPLLKDRDIFGSKRILFNIYFNPEAEDEFLLREANELTQFISNIDPNVDVIWGLAEDRTLGNRVKITLLAAGFSTSGEQSPLAQPAAKTAATPPAPTDVKIEKPEEAAAKISKLYGEDKSGTVVRTRETQKHIILTPEQMSDDSVIETFERTPTYTRDRRMVEDLRTRSAKKEPDAQSSDSERPDTGNPGRPSGTCITF